MQKTLKEQLVGTWSLASWEQVMPDGSKVHNYGTNPKGVVVFDTNGRLFVMFARPDLPKIASNAPRDRDRGGSQSAGGRIACLLRHVHCQRYGQGHELSSRCQFVPESGRKRSETNDHLSHGGRTEVRHNCVGWRQNRVGLKRAK